MAPHDLVAPQPVESEVIIETRGLSRVYPGVTALDNVNYRVYRNKVNVLIGENGAGKSTMMKMLAGVETPSSGQIILDGEAVSLQSTHQAEKLGISIIFQELAANFALYSTAALVGILMVLIGFFFKMSIIPFHMWAPDIYQGAPTPITALLATASKTAAVAALIRVLFMAFAIVKIYWLPVLILLSTLSMIDPLPHDPDILKRGIRQYSSFVGVSPDLLPPITTKSPTCTCPATPTLFAKIL